MKSKHVTIDNVKVPIGDEQNLLDLIRKANIELPTFCYHSEISVYGACRMCMVDIEGQGLLPSCSTPIKPGMVVQTNTGEIRNLRRMIVELMLANHEENCATCPRSEDCRLRSIAIQLGVERVRFKKVNAPATIDDSSDGIIRDPSKCVLCGDCVRVCNEIQSVGVLDFANRGSSSKVVACFDKKLGEVECVQCGQCIKVCPTGALYPKYEINPVWKALHNSEKTVVVQIAPAVRVALGEYFGFEPGTTKTGQIVTALRMMGFDKVFDTSFTADLTVIEEGNEFLRRYQENQNLPQFTSCCPAWVKFAEQYYPDLLENLSSCRSPQQMFGSLCKEQLTEMMNIPREDLVVVSIMPCTAKKFEAKRPEFSVEDNPDVDYVLTTRELSLMIKEQGIRFNQLEPGSFDLPFGFKTGAGVIFGVSGGVSEAVLRYAASQLGASAAALDTTLLRSLDGLQEVEISLADTRLKLAVVSGLANARKLLDEIRKGTAHYDLVEVMACCGGCVNGGGQPIDHDKGVNKDRAQGLYDSDKMMQFHSAEENPYITKLYDEDLSAEEIHHLLHTRYNNRKRIDHEEVELSASTIENPLLDVNICFGTSCYLRGAQELYKQVVQYLKDKDVESQTQLKATFCTERCKRGPVITINGKTIEHCSPEMAIKEINQYIS
ncbi:MAG: [FeFe] hydrogenase, group A [Anaerovoracaceae bacterium]|jgi:NADH-quinone oxidoreductase subunit G|nr:[FeFe] hydrogenase, group A [Anaerovoracaceae bacterium]